MIKKVIGNCFVFGVLLLSITLPTLSDAVNSLNTTRSRPSLFSIKMFSHNFTPYISANIGTGISSYSESMHHSFGPGSFHFSSSGQRIPLLLGVTVGVERSLNIFTKPWFWQLGLSFEHYGKSQIHGVSSQGIPGTESVYNYHYDVSSDSMMVITKLMWTLNSQWYPYGQVGIGYASNRAQDYQVTPQQIPADVPVHFASKTHNGLAYQLGLGVDYQLDPRIRLSAGYRFTALGHQELGAGSLDGGNRSIAYPGSSLGQDQRYNSSVQLELSYLL